MTEEADVERLLREHRARLVCELEAVEEELARRTPLPSRAQLVRAREEMTSQIRAESIREAERIERRRPPVFGALMGAGQGVASGGDR
jgi:hypothetical protein